MNSQQQNDLIKTHRDKLGQVSAEYSIYTEVIEPVFVSIRFSLTTLVTTLLSAGTLLIVVGGHGH
jgi:hypothetical protein